MLTSIVSFSNNVSKTVLHHIRQLIRSVPGTDAFMFLQAQKTLWKKKENTGYQIFLLFQQLFLEYSSPGPLKLGTVWQGVQGYCGKGFNVVMGSTI